MSGERIAKDEQIPHFALNAGRRSKRKPPSHHINTVNALIGRFSAFMAPICGPVSKNLAAYRRWRAARSELIPPQPWPAIAPLLSLNRP